MPRLGAGSGRPGQEPQEVSMLKPPKTIGLLALPLVLAAALITASGAFAKAPAHQAGATAPTAAQTPAPDVEPADTETNDAAGGHADDPHDAHAAHQFNGEGELSPPH